MKILEIRQPLAILLIIMGIVTATMITSCGDSDDEEPSYTESYLNGDYTPDGTNKLILTVDGKDAASENTIVTVNTTDNKTATLTLKNAIATQKTITVKNVTLKLIEDEGLAFSGKYEDSSVAFAYSGILSYPTLTLDITIE